MSELAHNEPLVLVLDDDEGMRQGIVSLLRSVSIEATAFATTADLLEASLPDRPCCIVLDVRLPGMSGLDLQDRLPTEGIACPIIFITGHADVPMSVRAMKGGAVDFLTKPFRDQELLDAVLSALRQDSSRRERRRERGALQVLAKQLSPREVEVLRAVRRGLLNKQIAYELSLSEVTVKMHRGSAAKKLNAKSSLDLIRITDLLNL